MATPVPDMVAMAKLIADPNNTADDDLQYMSVGLGSPPPHLPTSHDSNRTHRHQPRPPCLLPTTPLTPPLRPRPPSPSPSSPPPPPLTTATCPGTSPTVPSARPMTSTARASPSSFSRPYYARAGSVGCVAWLTSTTSKATQRTSGWQGGPSPLTSEPRRAELDPGFISICVTRGA